MLDVVQKVTGRSYLLYLLPSIVQGLASIAVVPLITFYLNPVDFGVYALIIALAIPVRSLAASGASWVIGGNYFKSSDYERRILLFNVLLVEFIFRGTLILLLFAMAEPILRWVVLDYHPDYLHYLRLVLVATLAGSMWPTISFFLSVHNNPRLFMLLSLVQTFTNIITTAICLVEFHLGVESLFVAMLLSSSVSFVFELLYVKKYVSFSLKGKWMREIFSTGFRATPGSIAEMVSNMSDRLAIERLVGLGALGIYSHSQQYLSIFKMVTGALSSTLMADSLRIYSKHLDTSPIVRLLQLWYGILACVGVFIALFSDNTIAWLTHDKFSEAAPLVQVWFLWVFSVSHGIPYASFLMAQKKSQILMYTQLFPTLLGIGFVVLGTYLFGVYGAAWALVLTNVVIQLARWIIAKRLGYCAFFGWRFAEASLVYVSLCLVSNLVTLRVSTEVVICIITLSLIMIKYDLIGELKYVLAKGR